MTLVDKIRFLAENQSMSLAELERRLNLSQGSIRKWDQSSPSFEKVESVANFFNVSTDFLIGRETYEEMKLKQARTDFEDDDFLTSYRLQRSTLEGDKQEAFTQQMKEYMDLLKLKYKNK